MAFQGLLLIYSGGTGNTYPHSSLGGQAAQSRPFRYVTPQKATYVVPLQGVHICVIRGSSLGASWLIYYEDDHSLTWILPGTVSTQSDAGPAPLLPQTLNMPPNAYPPERYTVKIQGDGYYELGNGAKSMLLYVTEADLPATRTILSFTTEDNKHNIFDALTQAESNTGDVEYRCLYIQNKFSDPVSLKFSITTQPSNSFVMVANEYQNASPFPSLSEAETQQLVDLTGNLLANGPSYNPETDAMLDGEDLFLQYGGSAVVDGYQNTDGLTGDLPSQLIDESDSTNVLAGFYWSTDAVFTRLIPSGNMVSIWLKRVKPSYPTSPVEESFGFQILYQGDLLTTPWERSSGNFVTLPTITVDPPSAIAMNHRASLKLEDGSGLLLLEDASGYLQLEDVNYG